jgi:hypothetical protein
LTPLQRAFAVTSAGIEGGKNLAESAQDLERTRKAINVQLAEFDGVKKSLMRDLQNRCEKVVELEIQLDEIKEQYNNVIRNSNSKAQQKKMAFLERNLEQLTLVQKQVFSDFSWLSGWLYLTCFVQAGRSELRSEEGGWDCRTKVACEERENTKSRSLASRCRPSACPSKPKV